MMKQLTLAVILVAAGIFGAVSFGKHLRAENTSAELPKEVATALTPAQLLSVLDSDVVMGNVDAPITIVEYASLSCSHCAAFHETVVPQLKKTYIDTGKAKYVLRNFPLNGPAFRGALLMNCIDDSQYYAFAEVLFAQQDKWAFSGDFVDSLRKIAALGGYSEKDFNACMANEGAKKEVLARVKHADEVLNIASTPTIFINGERIDGSGNPNIFTEKVAEKLKGLGLE
jgi:protein-disulfide isomerase